MTGLALESRRQLRQLLLLGVLVLGVVLAGGLAVIVLSARAVDQAVIRQEQALIQRTLDRRLTQQVVSVTSATVWDEAYERVVTRFDPDWVDVNFSRYYANYMDHDRTLVFGPDHRLLHESEAGRRTAAGALATFAADVSPLVTRVRQARAGMVAAHGLSAAATEAALVRSGGRIWLVAVSSVTPETAAIALVPGPDTVVVSARQIDPDYLKGLEGDLGLGGLHLMAGGVAPAGVAAPLTGPDSEVLGRLAWTPDQPGRSILSGATGLIILVMIAFLLTGCALAHRIAAALRSLSANDARLQAAEADLTRARDGAERARLAKTLFLANVGHEIRTPLNGVLGMTQVMERGELPPAQRKHLALIRESGAALLRLIDDVLDLARVESGTLEVQPQGADLTATITGACNPHMASAHDKGLKLGVAIEPSAGGVWVLDGQRLSQVLGNLVSNAIKFTARGQVSVRAWRSDRGLEFAVLDSGVGIEPERIGALFARFDKLERGTTRRFGGTGLGLALCRELVVLMGGEIAVESTVGEGSYFSFFLPAEPVLDQMAA